MPWQETVLLSLDFSVQPVCSLYLCGCGIEQPITTETQRTQRLHGEAISTKESADFFSTILAVGPALAWSNVTHF